MLGDYVYVAKFHPEGPVENSWGLVLFSHWDAT